MIYNKVNLVSNDKLPERVNDFINDLVSVKGKSLNTAKTYSNDLLCLFRFLKASKNNLSNINLQDVDVTDINDRFIHNINKQDLTSYVSFLYQQGNSINDRRRQISAMRAFYKYLINDCSLIKINIADKIDMPQRQQNTEPIYLDIDESKKLINYVSKYTSNKERNHCIVDLFLGYGLRVSELCNINLNDIDNRNNELTVLGKGNKKRVLCLTDKTINIVNTWLNKRNSKIDKIDDKQALFISKSNQRITTRGVESLVKDWSKELDLGDKITPHKLRHTCATNKYKSGVDILQIKELLGHSDISTTQIYTHTDKENMRNACAVDPYQ